MDSYKVEEYRIWKGVDPHNKTWHSRGFVGTKDRMEEIMEYLLHNNNELVLRVVPYFP
jgi:hypothetical protein